ncbi:hypothetical protein GOP47_0019462 [Adiantum capillus-veneris]|uniref:Uncharacterized protein n=1 Tax=Adiantum capillus-veneris TaxID=13818 RepID=A0A9D4UBV8_ADICA|nr:hypothetical protein GOP47_0019462 [Adiantum capillus-veneris]
MSNAVTQASRATSQTQRETNLSHAGLSGDSVLWKFFDLYGFDLSRDLVYDTMHVLPLNLFCKYTSNVMRGLQNESKKKVDECCKLVYKLAPPSIRNGRWPHTLRKYFEGFKAEENQKFVQWCLPYVLSVINEVSRPMYELGLLLIEIAHTFYNFSREKGWTKESIKIMQSLFSSWRVRSEEFFGPKSSPLEHIAGNGELLDDIIRHGSHDVYWCYIFERMVSIYMGVKTNKKNNEITYVHFYKRVLFTLDTRVLQEEKDGFLPHERNLSFLHQRLILLDDFTLLHPKSPQCSIFHEKGLLELSSLTRARELCHKILVDYELAYCHNMIRAKGIGITKKKRTKRYLSDEDKRYFQQLWAMTVSEGENTLVTTYQKILYQGEAFKVGDRVTVKQDNGDIDALPVGHWKAKIKTLFSIEHNGQYYLYFGTEYYRQCISSHNGVDELIVHHATRMSIAQQQTMPYTWDCVRPISSLMHKFIPLPLTGNRLVAYEVKDLIQRKRLQLSEMSDMHPLG